jgi:rubredoxin
MNKRILCEGCGLEYTPDQMNTVGTLVNLRDGSQREITFDGRTCCDFWDESEPGDWVDLASGEEVQRAHWRCGQCDGVYNHDMVKLLQDTDYERPAFVCSFCQKKQKNRFVER